MVLWGSCLLLSPRSWVSSCLNLGLVSSPNLMLRKAGYRPSSLDPPSALSCLWGSLPASTPQSRPISHPTADLCAEPNTQDQCTGHTDPASCPRRWEPMSFKPFMLNIHSCKNSRQTPDLPKLNTRHLPPLSSGPPRCSQGGSYTHLRQVLLIKVLPLYFER